jgi:hypothetical protein
MLIVRFRWIGKFFPFANVKDWLIVVVLVLVGYYICRFLILPIFSNTLAFLSLLAWLSVYSTDVLNKPDSRLTLPCLAWIFIWLIFFLLFFGSAKAWIKPSFDFRSVRASSSQRPLQKDTGCSADHLFDGVRVSYFLLTMGSTDVCHEHPGSSSLERIMLAHSLVNSTGLVRAVSASDYEVFNCDCHYFDHF